MHLLPGDPPLVFAVEGSRLFAVDSAFFAALAAGKKSAEDIVLGSSAGALLPGGDAPLGPATALSLNVAQSCNLSCGYCYAGEGRFGGRSMMMSREVAHRAVLQLLEGAPGQRLTIGFIGGEPFLNRDVVFSTVDYALSQAARFDAAIHFSVTTNATLLNSSDLQFLRNHSFVVSVSLDGASPVNDPCRQLLGGGSSFAKAIEALRPLLEQPDGARLNARATVTGRDLRVAERIDALAQCGFAEIGVSPVRSSPDPSLIIKDDAWSVYLAEMIRAAEVQRRRFLAGHAFTFSNLAIALKQIHSGYCKPLPCGSAASYLSVDAEGEYFTCHRTIGNHALSLGTIDTGLSTRSRASFLRERHVDRQEPCRACWARYLCGGGCHAEVLSAGRCGCDFIRGWLEYCLRFYDDVLRQCPDWLQGGMPR